jgi:hypothetical protein
MANPLSTQNHDNFYLRYDGVQVPSSEFHWKDGWELMYVNLGKFPNDDPSNIPAPGTFYYDYYGQGVYNEVARPLTIPYFALYNRYRGLLRVFYSYWDSNTLGQKEVTVKLGIIGNTSANGTLRHGNAIDRAMDLPTISDHIVSPKRVDGESNQWGIAEFQLGYDPCVCFYQSQLLLEFQIVDDYNISMQSRSLSFQDTFTLGTINSDFLGLNTDGQNVQAGYYVYKRMENAFTNYEEKLDKYDQQLSDYMHQ